MHYNCILLLKPLNLSAEYIVKNARLEEIEIGIKIAGRDINKLSYTEDIILITRNEKDLRNLLMKAGGGSANPSLLLNNFLK